MQVATTNQGHGLKPTIKSLLQGENFKRQVSLSLPRHCTPDRFVRVALTALTRQPKLNDCTQPSFFQALMDLSAIGLEPDGRRAHLIPYRDNKTGDVICQLIVDYKGLVDLVRRSGEVSDIHADVVCENDEFSYCYGTGSHLKHKPKLGDRGHVIAAYSYVRLKDGGESFEVLSKNEIEKVRSRSKARDNGPWVTDWESMARKTAFRRHSKWLPLSPELREKVERDDDVIDVPTIQAPPASEPMQELPGNEPQALAEPRSEGETMPGPPEQPKPRRGRPRNPQPKPKAQAEEPAGDEATLPPQVAFSIMLDDFGATLDDFNAFARSEGITDQDYGTIDEMPLDLCQRMLRAKVGLKAAIDSMKGGAQ